MVNVRSFGVDSNYCLVGDSISAESRWMGRNCRSNVIYHTKRNSVVSLGIIFMYSTVGAVKLVNQNMVFLWMAVERVGSSIVLFFVCEI